MQFLDESSARFLIARLAGIDSVNVRVMGAHDHAGPEVVAFLRASGYEVSTQTLERMVPPPRTRFALRYTGRWTQRSFRARERELRRDLLETMWVPTDEARFARFDPPWTPWFRRHNEVVVPVVPR